MGLSKRAKIGIGIIGAVLISSWGVYTYVQKQKELKRELTIEETRDLRPFSAVDKTYSNEEGQLVMTFKFEKDYIDENKRQKMEYYLYNSQNDELTKLPLDLEDKVEYTIDLKEAIRPEIMKFVNTGDGQYPYDPYRFQELLRNEFVDEHLYWIATPKDYIEKYTIDKYNKFAKENSFFTTSSDIAFELDLTEQNNYAVKLSIKHDTVNMYGKHMPILIINDWEVSIRPCELNNFSEILNNFTEIQSNHNEYKKLMEFIKKSRFNILDILLLETISYEKVKEYVTSKSKKVYLFKTLDACREIILNNRPGCNLLRYLSYNLNNKIMKLQKDKYGDYCKKLSNLRVVYGCIPFDEMPFVSSLIGHNPKIYDLLWCIDTNGREHELLARKIQINSQTNGKLYTSIDELKSFENINLLIEKYNSNLYCKHRETRGIGNIGNNYYIKGFEDDVINILKKLKEISQEGIENYENSVESWLNTGSYIIDCRDKKQILKTMFSNSKVSLIYGAAGTGKSTMINHVSNFFGLQKKLLLANTNPAVDNLKRKVSAPNCEFKTVAKYLYSKENQDCDLLIIDECSTVSNSDMIKILSKADFKLLILVGDIYQIESITFGNWFKLAKNNVSRTSVFELTAPYRTKDKPLLNLWTKVRKNEDDLIEYLTANNYSVRLDESVFFANDLDEIILCLNYDGLYGINNINRFLQSNNSNKSVNWGVVSYKIGDPVLFNETSRFSPALFNNLKGKISNIEKLDTEIIFDIEIETVINEMDIGNLDLELISSTKNNSVVRFSVYKYLNMSETDNDSDDTVVPFQIAYAISIHKAQGLEFNSVKLIITDEVDELITHNILYTAITRTKKNLKIYWTPETEKKVIENIKIDESRKDESILKRKLK
ncbi:ATP-dependent DNA helicase [Enterococcus faecium]|uniref:ATP-dependent DNA helicase n=1 Tax=Enterococcus faecium TaxID=1352 RepID=UPI0021574FA9|nr:ATP-dependent RecD-like DNA helicase [Enterococcus faecium]